MNATENFLQRHHGIVRRSVWAAEGLSLYSLYSLKNRGTLSEISPGIYATPDAMTRQEEIVQLLSVKHPSIVMNLLSALQFHQMTTQIPQSLFVAIPRGTRAPKLSFCPLSVRQMLPELIDIGMEIHHGKWSDFKVFNRERCLVDIFRLRHEFGQDIFLEALQEYRRKGNFRPSLIMEYAERLWVLKKISPYLETSL